MAGIEPSWNGDVALATLQPASSFPELYQELWWYSGSYSYGQGSGLAGSSFLTKGNVGFQNTNGAYQLFTLNANTPPYTQFALEIAGYYPSGTQPNVGLWDVTSSSLVTGSTIAFPISSMTVIRSSKFSLTPGHTYAITVWCSLVSQNMYITDASLIIFPSSPLTSPSVSAISLANPSGNGLKEAYYPLWLMSNGAVYNAGVQAGYLQKGSSSMSTVTTGSAVKLYNLSSSWSSTQKFALEASVYSNNASYTGSLTLYDVTASTTVSGATVSTTSTTATLLRSGTFTLTPGHWYGMSLQSNNSGGNAYLTKAHLVALA